MLPALASAPRPPLVSWPDLDWHFIHIGGGELKKGIEMRARRLGIENRIEWRGKRSQQDVIAELRSSDLFVLPSVIAEDGDRDGLPNVLMEAASQKLPILSTAVSASWLACRTW